MHEAVKQMPVMLADHDQFGADAGAGPQQKR